ncbi:Hpt domain-containing protein [uncultured Draconibacterium sp.]|uniref:Hpt domain-containing protein n=1 Tax=uncultured Draconibacterium sp. TaxID=1573823 RepID=UPI003216FFCA
MDNQTKLIHTHQIDAISGGDNSFKIELINIFLEQIPEFIQNMTSSYENKDWTLLAREAHTAKSSALTFGMDETGMLLKDIQLNTEKSEFDTLSALIEKAISQLSSAVIELEAMKKSL